MDEYSIGALFIVLLILFFLSAFFSGSETALMALNRYRLRHLANDGHRGAKQAQKLLEKPDRLIGLILLGNNVVNILIAQLAAYIGYRWHGELGIFIATLILIFAILIFAELAPKTLAAVHSEKVAFPAAMIYTPLMYITFPFVWFVNLIANSLLNLFGVDVKENPLTSLTHDELRTVVNDEGTTISNEHQQMLLGVLDLEKITAEDIMIPKNEIIGIDLEEEWEDIVTQLKNISYTRVPVYRNSIDNVVGFLHLRKFILKILDKDLEREDLEKVIREPYFIPEGTHLKKLLFEFQEKKRRLSLVVDEFGDIQGMVTLEDLLEEIVGEFTNDPASYDVEIHPQKDGTFLVDGSSHVRDINKALTWQLHADGPKTINGLILEHMQSIPKPGTSVLIDGYPIEVVQIQNNAVRTVRISPRLAQHEQVA
ncbi:MAG: HlyC/CorC family transporter [Gammaproteobacteria bacterium]|nr:HlyC/CorC family transporter [Gammaproteobacteria bacterium]NNC66746.1 HlyC/CorC family transporter [Gammaproteobacteria bacterium]